MKMRFQKIVAMALAVSMSLGYASFVSAADTKDSDSGTFTVNVNHPWGGVLDVHDTTADMYLPIGEDVEIPAGNKLEMKAYFAPGAELDKIIVNGSEVKESDAVTITKDTDMVATFKASDYVDPDEGYRVGTRPNEFIVDNVPAEITGRFELFHYMDFLVGATYEMCEKNDGNDNDKFTLLTPEGEFKSNGPISGYYTIDVNVTYDGVTHYNMWAEVYVSDAPDVFVNFFRAVAYGSPGASAYINGHSIRRETRFGDVTPTVPKMYNHAARAQWADNQGTPISNDLKLTAYRTNAYIGFDGYRIDLLDLNGVPTGGNEPDRPSSGGGSGGSSGGSGGSVIGGSASGGSNTVNTGTAKQSATVSVENAVKSAVNAGVKNATAEIKFKNTTKMSPDLFKAMNEAAAKASQGSDVTVKATVLMDTTDKNGSIKARMYIDPIVAAGLEKPIKTTVDVSPKGKENAKTAAIVDKYFDNNAAVISFAQEGAFGMSIPVAVKVDTSNMDTKELQFYSYDAKTNSFNVIADSVYYMDSNGYVHFTTSVGGSIVITDKPMTKK